MAWTPPLTWDTGRLVTAADLNAQIRDNLLYLKSPPAATISGQTVQLTSTTFAPLVETQNIITTAGARALIATFGHCYAPTGGSVIRFYLNLEIDGSMIASTEGVQNGAITGTQYHGAPWALTWLTGTLEPAFHTFRLYGRVASGTVSFWIGHFLVLGV